MRSLSCVVSIFAVMLVLGAVSSCAAQKNKGLSALPQDIRAQVEAALSSVRIDDTDKERIVDAIGEDPSGFAFCFAKFGM